MLFQNALLALLASSSIAVAFPGYGGKTTCSAVYVTKTTTGDTQSTVLTTKTVYVPVTSVTGKAQTSVKECPYTSVGASIKVYVQKTVTKYETAVDVKTYPVTTVTYITKYETRVKEKTSVETSPFTLLATSYKTEVATIPKTYVTSVASTSVCTETKIVPYTTTSVETKTACATKGGYGY
ncbi:hypothetical protein K469DRAFT_554522 [Zopfia rhizophila CBS 207.26]|uniref:Uncharacterized protein n=1 Tax=Zopfia rhizophila CBS 207.26 TaxID=1314779 RepID=A0A6A6ENQ4_9PEZI|nr:hypothetical protein K469DRAFT_554522 [Zopfia rhizophila CBS 207.26]